MVQMKALVGFSLPDGAAAAGAPFNAANAKAADRLETAGVAERVKVGPVPMASKQKAPADRSTGAPS
ncbi:hypothetical protein D3C85_828330 [compost metagenome]